MADLTVTGLVTDFEKPEGKAPVRFKVGGQKVKAWKTFKQDGMEIANPAIPAAIAADGEPVTFLGYVKEETYTLKQGPNAGETKTEEVFYAVDGGGSYQAIPYLKPNGATASPTVSLGASQGRSGGFNEEFTAMRWAFSSVLDARTSLKDGETLKDLISDELIATAVELFRAVKQAVADEGKGN